jgi:hypothetical protein
MAVGKIIGGTRATGSLHRQDKAPRA